MRWGEVLRQDRRNNRGQRTTPHFGFAVFIQGQHDPQDNVLFLERRGRGKSKLECSGNNSDHPQTVHSIKNEAKATKMWIPQIFWGGPEEGQPSLNDEYLL